MILEVILRHYKTYNNKNTIPVSKNSRFITYIGDNGVGKSSIFEALDSLFNKKDWNINLKALSGGGLTNRNEPFVSCLFAIEKTKIDKDFEAISKAIDEIIRKEFPKYEYTYNDCYLLQVGKIFYSNKQPEIYFGSKDTEIKNEIKKISNNNNADITDGRTEGKLNRKINEFGEYILCLYSYVYIPVEMDIKEFSYLVNNEMQKLTGKNIRDEIGKIIENKKVSDINNKLKALVDNISKKLVDYSYDFKSKGKHTISMDSLVSKIIEEYFTLRILKKGTTEVSKLSSGEKRKALVELCKSLLKAQESFQNYLILVVDEPEASLNLTKCFFQFEDLYELSQLNFSIQIMIATHWYGHLPIIKDGEIHFLSHDKGDKIKFDSFTYNNYVEKSKKQQLPEHVTLKSTNDLVQSIVATLRNEDKPYNWLICEGSSDKKYLEYFLENEIKKYNLRILPVGGIGDVIKIYKYLMLPIEEKNSIHGKIFCLVDTDTEIHKYQNIPKTDSKKLKIMRLENCNNSKATKLIEANNISNNLTPTVIENSLDKEVFNKAIRKLALNETNIIKILDDEENLTDDNNSFFCFVNMRAKDKEQINSFISTQKVKLADTYIEIAMEQDSSVELNWINDIKKFFNGEQ
jgi:ABC-type phosphate/phosphonate transport system ATPase subunit